MLEPHKKSNHNSFPSHADIIVVGGGAAGLMAAITAARSNKSVSIAILDGARKLGAKILVAGGGRCNVTHEIVNADAFAGTSRNSIKKVLLRFGVKQTLEFFHDLGVPLKLESTGKYFPVSNSSKDILNALLAESAQLGIKIYCSHRVTSIGHTRSGFKVGGNWGYLQSGKVIVATGGMSLPKSGSDGLGYSFCEQLGHTLTKRIFPALVPLLLPQQHFITSLSGISLNAKLTAVNSNNKEIVSFTNSILCTHFGLSGPGVLDMSRYWLDLFEKDECSKLMINWLVDTDINTLEEILLDRRQQRTLRNVLSHYLPARLVDELCLISKIPLTEKVGQLTKFQRKALLANIYTMELPIAGNRGFQFAEVTAGGVPLTEVDLKTMHSRHCQGLYLCGEVCDVDGRIGGFNFQWAWASGFVCGQAVAQ